MATFSDRQKKIILASIELITENGIQGLTIRSISRKIGISEAAIYRHFDTKIDILLGTLSYFGDNSLSAVERILSSEATGVEMLKRVFLNCFETFIKEPALTSVIFSEEIFQNDRRLADKIFSIMEERKKIISRAIQKGQQEGEIRQDVPCDQLSIIIMGTLRLIVKKWRLSGYSFDLKEEGLVLWESLQKLLKGASCETY